MDLQPGFLACGNSIVVPTQNGCLHSVSGLWICCFCGWFLQKCLAISISATWLRLAKTDMSLADWAAQNTFAASENSENSALQQVWFLQRVSGNGFSYLQPGSATLQQTCHEWIEPLKIHLLPLENSGNSALGQVRFLQRASGNGFSSHICNLAWFICSRHVWQLCKVCPFNFQQPSQLCCEPQNIKGWDRLLTLKCSKTHSGYYAFSISDPWNGSMNTCL